jgi:hypothetical protein
MSTAAQDLGPWFESKRAQFYQSVSRDYQFLAASLLAPGPVADPWAKIIVEAVIPEGIQSFEYESPSARFQQRPSARRDKCETRYD